MTRAWAASDRTHPKLPYVTPIRGKSSSRINLLGKGFIQEINTDRGVTAKSSTLIQIAFFKKSLKNSIIKTKSNT